MPDLAKPDGADVPGKRNFDWRTGWYGKYLVGVLYARYGFVVQQADEQEVGTKHLAILTCLGYDTGKS